ncbi:hypothetical protein HK103_007179 [Boothiomyces macroporosus]|uniref:Thioredoxin domain-containing protein n=1 Tax=Boothiomyces macroporosus TaxID=261099 RepID=A0AAD5Y462_9FUNG|nr:hypothetical protein HK103_007179 [Boothiomyces macroporosus]
MTVESFDRSIFDSLPISGDASKLKASLLVITTEPATLVNLSLSDNTGIIVVGAKPEGFVSTPELPGFDVPLLVVNAEDKIIYNGNVQDGIDSIKMNDQIYAKIKFARRGWQSPVLKTKFDYSLVTDLVYMSDIKLDRTATLPRILYIERWFKSCSPCIEMWPKLCQLQDEWGSKAVVLTISRDIPKKDDFSDILESLQGIDHGRVMKAVDLDGKFEKFQQQSEFMGYPSCFIVIDGVIEYVGVSKPKSFELVREAIKLLE